MTANYTQAKLYGATDVGQVRSHNEDNFLIIDSNSLNEGNNKNNIGTLLLVADGMGGANAGEVASAIACEVIKERFTKLNLIPVTPREIEKYLKNLILEAHNQIISHSAKNPECRGMGTTAVLCWIIDDYLHVAWCGDSRCYTFLPGQQEPLLPLTADHSLVWQMVTEGEITPEQARVHEYSNIILQSLGSTDSKPIPSYLNKKLSKGEKILVCSDGLNGMLSDWEIQKRLELTNDVQKISHSLIEAAIEAGGTDNITAVLAEIELLGEKSKNRSKSFLFFSKAKWLILLTLGGLVCAFLIFGFLSQSQRTNSVAQDEEHLKENYIELTEAQKESLRKEVKVQEKVERTQTKKASSIKKNSSPAVNAASSLDFNFREELTEINTGLEKIVESNKKHFADCHKCPEDQEFKKVNNLLSDTQWFVREQLNFIHKNEQNFLQNEQSLERICAQAEVSYSLNEEQHPNELSKKIWITRTLNLVLKKIDDKFKELIKKPVIIESAS